MPAKQIAIRAASLVLLTGAAGVYAVNAGLVPGIGGAAQTTEITSATPQVAPPQAAFAQASLSSTDTPAPTSAPTPPIAPTPPMAPALTDTAEIQLPRQAVVPVAGSVTAAPVQPPAPILVQATEPAPALSAFGLPCDLTVTATAMPGAMVALDVMAPCQPDARVVVEHSGLTLTAQTDAMGLMTMDIPAFETPAFFNIELPDGTSEATLVGLPDLPDYDRVAVQWEGDSQLELHAMEFGAVFGGPGHIWEGAPGTLDTALSGDSGFLTEIGDPSVAGAHVAQIYTFPRSTLRAGDAVRLSVDAPITEGNCGKPITAHTLQIRNSGTVEVTPISLTMPGCDAVGDYLMLQNLLQDLRLASN